jgi:O-antigen ligase
MISKDTSRLLAILTAVVGTVATFAKWFVPFYLIGSTPIFVATCFLGLVLIAFASRNLVEQATYTLDILALLILLYCLVIASFLINSLHRVPITYLLGILVFHGLFLLFGFAASRALKAVFAVLAIGAAVYLIIIARYVLRFGDLMHNGFLMDVFGTGNPELYNTFHQLIGNVLALAELAVLGFHHRRTRLLALASLPFVFLFLFHIGARTALVALICGLFFLVWAGLWLRSRKLALTSLAALIVSVAIASTLFYQFALRDTEVHAINTNVIIRTINELQSQDPGFRLPIWGRAWHRVAAEPDHLALGRGVGAYSIDEGFGPPTWLLDKSPKHYPHNIYLELLYETGIPGFLIFTLLTLLPLFFSLKHWDQLSAPERAAIAIYVFSLVTVEISGSFAYSYDFQFFYGLAAGVVALKRRELMETGTGLTPANASRVLEIEKTAS